MRTAALLFLAGLITCSAQAQQGVGLATAALSRCAAKIGTETRQADPAFGTFGLDGPPWITVERTDEKIGSFHIATTIAGTGWRRRRDGTSVHFRYTCALDPKGDAVIFHATPLLRNVGDELPPATVVEGVAAFPQERPLPRGMELQIQLLDVSKSQSGQLLTEQVVRTGWQVPIPFELRLPKTLSLGNRKFEITARIVRARQPLFHLAERHLLSADDLHKSVVLTLSEVGKPTTTKSPTTPR